MLVNAISGYFFEVKKYSDRLEFTFIAIATKNRIKWLAEIKVSKNAINSIATRIKLILKTKPKARLVLSLKFFLFNFFWSKKKAEIPKDKTVENKKINGISKRKSDKSSFRSLIPKNQNNINEKDFETNSFNNKTKLLDFEFNNLVSIIIIRKIDEFHKKE